MFSFLVPLRIIELPETLIIEDRRPTVVMLLCVGGFLLFLTIFVFLAFRVGFFDSFGLWAAGIFGIGCLALSFRGTLREVYYFDKTTDSYAFVRQFIHRKEVIEGTLSQFRGVRVHTHVGEESETYSVVLLQDGMFLTGVTEQTLREETPMLNSYSNEERIASSISRFLNIKLED